MTRRSWFGALATLCASSSASRPAAPINEAIGDRLFTYGVYDVTGRKVGELRSIGADMRDGGDGMVYATGTHYAVVNVRLAR